MKEDKETVGQVDEKCIDLISMLSPHSDALKPVVLNDIVDHDEGLTELGDTSTFIDML